MTTPREDAIAARKQRERDLMAGNHNLGRHRGGRPVQGCPLCEAALAAEAETPVPDVREDAIAARSFAYGVMLAHFGHIAPCTGEACTCHYYEDLATVRAALGAEAETPDPVRLASARCPDYEQEDCGCTCHEVDPDVPGHWVDLASPETAEALARAIASTKGSLEAVESLYDEGISWLDVPDEWYDTPRHLAAEFLAAMRETGR